MYKSFFMGAIKKTKKSFFSFFLKKKPKKKFSFNLRNWILLKKNPQNNNAKKTLQIWEQNISFFG